MGRVVLLLTSPRVGAGLLTRDAWAVLESARRVLCPQADHPQLGALSAAGVPVEAVAVASGGEAWRVLVEAAESGTVVWVAGEDGDPGLVSAVAAAVSDPAAPGPAAPEVEVITASYDLPGARLLDVVAVMDTLRARCPWDREQTHRSLVRYLVEETHEAVAAVESGDRDHLREELGDLLLQVVFHARLAVEDPDDPWTIDDVAGEIVAKLVRRHPHVFGDTEAGTAGDVQQRWDALKDAEKERRSVLDGVPWGLPALALADKVLARAPAAADPPALIKQIGELPVAPGHSAADAIGRRLLDVVLAARAENVDPEQALRDAVRDLAAVIRAAETG